MTITSLTEKDKKYAKSIFIFQNEEETNNVRMTKDNLPPQDPNHLSPKIPVQSNHVQKSPESHSPKLKLPEIRTPLDALDLLQNKEPEFDTVSAKFEEGRLSSLSHVSKTFSYRDDDDTSSEILRIEQRAEQEVQRNHGALERLVRTLQVSVNHVKF